MHHTIFWPTNTAISKQYSCNLWCPDTCTCPMYLCRTDTTPVSILVTAPILLEYKFSISYLPSSLYLMVLLVFLVSTSKMLERNVNNDNFIDSHIAFKKKKKFHWFTHILKKKLGQPYPFPRFLLSAESYPWSLCSCLCPYLYLGIIDCNNWNKDLSHWEIIGKLKETSGISEIKMYMIWGVHNPISCTSLRCTIKEGLTKSFYILRGTDNNLTRLNCFFLDNTGQSHNIVQCVSEGYFCDSSFLFFPKALEP